MKRINFYSVKLVKEKSGLYELDNLSGFTIRSPLDGYQAITTILDLNSECVEKFGILALNTKNKIVGIHICHVGGVNTSFVDMRTVFQNALLNNATSIICFHNHPSGDPSPSHEDIDVTKRLVECGILLGVEVLDHVIVGEEGRYVSLKEKGYL